MERQNPGPDTGKIELERIINCLKENHYEFEHLEESMNHGFMVANFKKDIKYSDLEGNYINDRHIRITIEFDSEFDYKNNYKDANDDVVIDLDKGDEFIQKLLENSYGGTRKKVIKRKKATRRFRKK